MCHPKLIYVCHDIFLYFTLLAINISKELFSIVIPYDDPLCSEGYMYWQLDNNLYLLCLNEDFSVAKWRYPHYTDSMVVLCNSGKCLCCLLFWSYQKVLQIHCYPADTGSSVQTVYDLHQQASKWQTGSGIQVKFFPTSRCFHAIKTQRCRSTS